MSLSPNVVQYICEVWNLYNQQERWYTFLRGQGTEGEAIAHSKARVAEKLPPSVHFLVRTNDGVLYDSENNHES